MNIHKFAEHEDLDAALQKGEPILAAISFDGKDAYMGHIDECMEHHILFAKSGLSAGDIDKYYRIVFDSDGAISAFLAELGLLIDIKIPKRYRRHLNDLD
ncbi:MAG: hypothetical protein FWE57_08395 [Chitinispirillia bacterium]|nr:hypothetical protein [Chitinispirillia bacterium]